MAGGYTRRDFAGRLAARSLSEFRDDRCPQLAASIAYHVLFSIFPLAIVLTAVAGIVLHTTGSRTTVVDEIVRNIPLSEDGNEQLRRLLLGATSDLSALGLFGVLGLVYSASGMMAAIRVALNAAWDVEATRPFLRGKLIDVGLVFLGAVLVLGTLGLTIALRFVGGGSWAVSIVAPLVVGFTGVLFLYRVVPAVEVDLRAAWPPALGVAVAFAAAENLFSLYVRNFASFNAVYGSLGAVIAFMFFVYLVSLLFLLGAEVASEIPRTRRELERHGPPEPGKPLRQQLAGALARLWRLDDSSPGEADSVPGKTTRGEDDAGDDGTGGDGDPRDPERVAGGP